MSKKELYIIRHGQTDYNKKRIIQGSGVDSDLNDRGRQQAAMFYDKYGAMDFDLVISSRLKRSYQTVEPFLKKNKLPYQSTPLINEICWGVHEGKEGNLFLKKAYEEMINEWSVGNFDVSLEGAESARELSDRVTRFVRYISSLPEERILICTHGRTLRCLMCVMKGQHLREMESYSHDNTGLFLAEQLSDFHFILENDTSHIIH